MTVITIMIIALCQMTNLREKDKNSQLDIWCHTPRPQILQALEYLIFFVMLGLTVGKERKRKDKEKKDLKMMSYNETVSRSTSDKKKNW